jgi:hypothetical protein
MKRKPAEYEKHLAANQKVRNRVHLSFDAVFAELARLLTRRKPSRRVSARVHDRKARD